VTGYQTHLEMISSSLKVLQAKCHGPHCM